MGGVHKFTKSSIVDGRRITQSTGGMPPRKKNSSGKRLCEDGLNCKYIHEYQHSLEFCHEAMPPGSYDWSKGVVVIGLAAVT